MDTPPVPFIDVPLNSFFAIQSLHRERPDLPVEALCTTAKMMGILFRRVETLDTLQIGMHPFLRMRSDLDPDHTREVLQQLHQATGRGIIYPTPKYTFEVQFPPTILSGRIAPVSSLHMHMVPRGTPTMFRGPKIKMWARQFPSS